MSSLSSYNSINIKNQISQSFNPTTTDASNGIKSPLEIIMIGAVLDCLMSFIPLPRDIVRMDEVVMSSREMKQNKISTWDFYLMQSPSSISMKEWNEMRHCKSSLQFMSKKRIPVTIIDFDRDSYDNDCYDGDELSVEFKDEFEDKRMFEGIRLEKVIKATFQFCYDYLYSSYSSGEDEDDEEEEDRYEKEPSEKIMKGLDDVSLIDFAMACPNLEHINLYKCDIRDASLEALAEHCPKLNHVDLNWCGGITDTGVLALVKGCHDIEFFDLGNDSVFHHEYTNLENASLIALSQHCPKLKHLHLNGWNNTCAPTMQKLWEGCANLQTLSIDYNGCSDYLSDACLISLSKKCHGLLNIVLRNCRFITDASIVALSEGCVDLQRVDISYDEKLTNVSVIALSKRCHGLLDFTMCQSERLTDAAIQSLSEGCRDLQKVDISDCPLLTDAAVAFLAKNCKGLIQLDVNHCPHLTDAVLLTVGIHCLHLESLVLGCNNHITEQGKQELKKKHPKLDIKYKNK